MDPIIKDMLSRNLTFLRSELIVNEGYLKQWLDERNRYQKKAEELVQSIEDCRRKIEAIEQFIEHDGTIYRYWSLDACAEE